MFVHNMFGLYISSIVVGCMPSGGIYRDIKPIILNISSMFIFVFVVVAFGYVQNGNNYKKKYKIWNQFKSV